jgi:phenylalanyl-tRNA synthetase beta subunit
VENLGLPDLTNQQIEQLCSIAEEAARKYILSKIPSKKVETLNITAEAQHTKPLQLTVDVDITLSKSLKNYDAQELCDDAVQKAFKTAEKYLRKLTCHTQT